jgi:DNA-binding FadR family transcriptional regulator
LKPKTPQSVLRSERGYREIASRILLYIAENRLEPGSRLPGEIKLSKICGVSRPTVREALIALEVDGRIDIRSSSGAFIRNAETFGLTVDSVSGPFELLRARMLIEKEVAADAALTASKTDICRIARKLQEMGRLIQAKADVQKVDREFHILIGEAAQNSVLTRIIDGLWTGMFESTHYVSSCCMANHEEIAYADHEAIFIAIAGRDPIGARLAMKRHLRHVEERLKEGNFLPNISCSQIAS